MEYKPCYSLDSLIETFNQEANKAEGNQFVEGLMFSLNSGVVMTSNMTTWAEPNKVSFLLTMHDRYNNT